MLMKKSLLCLCLFSPLSFGFCFEEAGQRYNVSPNLLKAIATVESNFNPKAYNENKNKSGQVISRDYGLMQINSTWFAKLSAFNVSEKNIYDPCFNVALGAWVLSSNFATHGYNWNSVGAYNAGFSSQSQNARNNYIQKVQKIYYSQHLK